MEFKLLGASVLLKNAPTSRLKWKLAVAVLGACSLGVVNMSASPIFGSFTISGQITVTQDAGTGVGHITWKSDLSPTFTADMFSLSASNITGPAGVLVNENGQNAIHDLTNSAGAQPVGVAFTDFDFIDFLVTAGLPNLDLDFINPGPFSICQNPTGPAAGGQVCTLPGSPFGFINSLQGGNCCTSSATFTFDGNTNDGDLSHWTGQFSTNFNTPYQTVIAPFLVTPPGAASVTNTFAGTVTITINPSTTIPEPASLVMIGSGLIGLAALLRRRVSR